MFCGFVSFMVLKFCFKNRNICNSNEYKCNAYFHDLGNSTIKDLINNKCKKDDSITPQGHNLPMDKGLTMPKFISQVVLTCICSDDKLILASHLNIGEINELMLRNFGRGV